MTAAASASVPAGLAPGGRAAQWDRPGVRAAFLDVDGTTTDLVPSASDAVVEAFARATAAGVRVGFATGRPPVGLRRLRRQLDDGGAAPPVDGGPVVDVVHNGAVVLADGEVLTSWPLPREAAHALGRWCVEQGVYAELYCGASFYVTDRREEAQIGWVDVSGPPDGDAADLDPATDVEKMTVNVFEVERLAEVVAVAEGLGLLVEHSSAPFLPGVPVLNVTAPGVTKGAALAWWAQRSGTPLEHVLAVGDGLNDTSMLAVVGTAVAMGQAPELVRAQAHLVTRSVEHDGLAAVLDATASGVL